MNPDFHHPVLLSSNTSLYRIQDDLSLCLQDVQAATGHLDRITLNVRQHKHIHLRF